MKAREGFRNEILRILRFALTEVEEEGMFKVVSLAGLGTLSFPDSVASNYGRARRLLLDEAQRAGKAISMQEVESRLDRFLVALASRKRKDLGKVDQDVIRLFREIRAISQKRYLFLIPIDYVNCPSSLTIGDSVITNLSVETLRKIERTEGITLVLPAHDLGDHVRKLVEWNRTLCFMLLRVEASDHHKALELAFRVADSVLSVLRLFLQDSPAIIHGGGLQDIQVTVSWIDLDKGTVSWSGDRPNLVLGPLIVNRQLIRLMKEKGLGKIHTILKKGSALSDLERRTLEGIFWNGDAVRESNPAGKLVKYVTALEVLLLTGACEQETAVGGATRSCSLRRSEPR